VARSAVEVAQRTESKQDCLVETPRLALHHIIRERTLRRLLIIGASGVVRWAKRKDVAADTWLGRMLARKPPMLVIVALANKIARVAWALLTKGGIYRAPVVSA
jgi:hypothetical protein